MITITKLKENLQLYRDSYISLGFKDRKTKNAIIKTINDAILSGTKKSFDPKLLKFLFKARYLYLTKKDKKLESDIYKHSLVA